MESEDLLHVHKRLPSVPVRSQINPVHTSHPISWRPILILSSHVCLGFPNGIQYKGVI